jgi:hypothetical protein
MAGGPGMPPDASAKMSLATVDHGYSGKFQGIGPDFGSTWPWALTVADLQQIE